MPGDCADTLLVIGVVFRLAAVYPDDLVHGHARDCQGWNAGQDKYDDVHPLRIEVFFQIWKALLPKEKKCYGLGHVFTRHCERQSNVGPNLTFRQTHPMNIVNWQIRKDRLSNNHVSYCA